MTVSPDENDMLVFCLENNCFYLLTVCFCFRHFCYLTSCLRHFCHQTSCYSIMATSMLRSGHDLTLCLCCYFKRKETALRCFIIITATMTLPRQVTVVVIYSGTTPRGRVKGHSKGHVRRELDQGAVHRCSWSVFCH